MKIGTTDISKIFLGTTEVQKIMLGNTEVYAALEKTTNPEIQVRYVAPFNIAEFRVRNMDTTGSAVILADTSNPPTTNRGTIAYNNFTSWISLNCQQGNTCGFSVYATAQVSGKDKSDVVAAFVE